MPWALAPPDLRPKLDDLGPPDDNTDLNATRLRHGLMPKLSGDPSQALLGDGSFGTPAATSLLADNIFTLYDNLDPTKLAQFQLSGLSTATTRTYTLQDASMTLAGINFANTFSKTQTIRADTATVSLIVQRASTGSAAIFNVLDLNANLRFSVNAGGRSLLNTTSTVAWLNVGMSTTANPPVVDLGQVAISTIFTQTAIAGFGNSGGFWRLTPTLTGDVASGGVGLVAALRVAPVLSHLGGDFTAIDAAITFGDQDATLGGSAKALNFTITTSGTAGSYSSVFGAVGSILHQSALPVTVSMKPLSASAILSNGSGLVTDLTMLNIVGNINAGSSTTDSVGIHIDVGGTGTSSTVKGIWIFDISSAAATSCWGLYLETNKQNWLNGNLGIGSGLTVPTAHLHITAGTTAAGTAPIKLNSGTIMTAAEAGAIEFTTDNLFFTITTGTERKRVVLVGADLTVNDNAALNLLKIRHRDTTDNSWLDDVEGYQTQIGDAASVGGLRNMIIGGSGASGSVFDRLGIQSKGTTFWNNTIATMPAPTAMIHIAAAGTTAASTAPLKFTSGTSMTSAEAGAFEFTTDDLFFTITTGPARKRILFADATGGLTSGKIPVATTNGRLADLTASSAYTPTNVTTDRAYDANATTLDEIADVVGTMIADLQTKGILG